MSKKDNLIETISKNKQVNVLLWFVVAVVIVVVSYVLYELYSGVETGKEIAKKTIEKIDKTLRSDEVSTGQINELRETIKNEYVAFSDMNTRVIDSLSQDGMLWGKNYLIQSAISCVEIGFDLEKMKIEQNQGKLTVNLGKPQILNSIPNGSSKPFVVRFEGYMKSEGDWSAADKMKLQEKVNEKMIRNCSEWNYYKKASDNALNQIKMLIQQKLDNWQKDLKIEIIVEE